MRNWKRIAAGVGLTGMLLSLPVTMVYSEEAAEEVQEENYETEEPIPESYYYLIESNETEGWPQGPAIESASAVVMDMDTGTLLYSKNATAKQYPASTTKIMTTLLLIENCNLDDTITFSEIVYNLEEGSSHLGIQPGEKMKLRDAAYGIMLASANDISNGVAEYMGGSLSGFADMMNQKAEELGCVNTHFSNPHGLFAEDHYTCAYDMALIAKAAYSNPVFREIAGTRYYEIPETNLTEEKRSFLNHQKILQPDEPYYQEWCTGGKTGYTEACLNTLVTFGEKDGQRLVGVVFRVNGAGKAYQETTQIMNYGFDEFETVTEKKTTEKTFYDLMQENAIGKASLFLSPAWTRKAASEATLCVTYPVGTGRETLQYEMTKDPVSDVGKIRYLYQGVEMGTAQGAFYPFAAPVQLSFEKTSAFLEENQTGEKKAQENLEAFNLTEIKNWGISAAVSCADSLEQFVRNNTELSMGIGFLLAAFLILFFILMILRSLAEYRLKRKRKSEEAEREKRAEEIERMTTAEIEAELRAAMEQEQRRKEREALEKAGEQAEDETDSTNP